MKIQARAVLFDLDGTLVDSAADIARALNTLLEETGRAALPLETVRPEVSNGSAALIRLAFDLEPGQPGFDALCMRLLSCYAQLPMRESTLFSGILSLLQQLEAEQRPWGIVTNKITRLTWPVLRALNLEARAACVVCGDTTAHCKPHPAPLLHACELLACEPAEAVYVGDAERDIQAGKAAGMGATIVALYGYASDEEQVQQWGADACVQSPQELFGVLCAS